MSEAVLEIAAGSDIFKAATPFLFAGMSGAFAVAGALTAAAFWRRNNQLTETIYILEERAAADPGVEMIFRVDTGHLTPITNAAKKFVDDALIAASPQRARKGLLASLFADDVAQDLAPRLWTLARDAENFEILGQDAFGRLWMMRGDITGAEALFRLWPAARDSRDDAAEARRARLLLEHGLEHAPVGVLLFDRALRLLDANANARGFFRLSVQFCGESPSFHALFDMVRDKGRAPERPDHDSWVQSLETTIVAGDEMEETWRLPDGGAYHIRLTPFEAGGVAVFVTDESDAAQLQRRYDLAMSARRETFAALDQGVAVIGASGRLRLANRAFAKLWSLPRQITDENMAGEMTLAQLGREAARDRLDEEIWSRIESAALFQNIGARRAERFTANRSKNRAMHINIAPLPEGAALITCADISDTHRAERALVEKAEALEQVDRQKSAFLEDISRRLRDPLQTVMGFGEMLRDESAGPLTKRQGELLRYIVTASHELRELTDDALALGALNAGSLELRSDELDIALMTERIAPLLTERAERRGAILTAEVHPGALIIEGDETRIRHALYSAGATVVNAAQRGDRIKLDLQLRSNSVGHADERVVFSMRLHRKNAIDETVLDNGAEIGGVAMILTKRIVEVHGGETFLGISPNLVEVLMDFPLLEIDSFVANNAEPLANEI